MESSLLIDSANLYDRIIIKNNSKNNDECPICLESFLNKQIMYLPCKHMFHSSCIKQSFQNKLYTCSLCRHDLKTALTKINYKFPLLDDFMFLYNSYLYSNYSHGHGDEQSGQIPLIYTYLYITDRNSDIIDYLLESISLSETSDNIPELGADLGPYFGADFGADFGDEIEHEH